jgi:hypothetical protein
MLIQLSDGSWIDPATVRLITAQPSEVTDTGTRMPCVVVAMDSDRFYLNCDDIANATQARDQVAALVLNAIAPAAAPVTS